MNNGYLNGSRGENGEPVEQLGAGDRAIVERFERATADEMEAMVAAPNAEQERALRLYLGDDRFRNMQRLALLRTVTRGSTAVRGNVVILPGLMGSTCARWTVEAMTMRSG